MQGPADLSAYEMLLDRQIIDDSGQPVGAVDDLELTLPAAGGTGSPELTAILTGPTALGPRIGGVLGRLWLAVGRRLRPADEEYPNRIPMGLVDRVDRTQVSLTVHRNELDVERFQEWVWENIIGRLPGSGR